MTRFWAPLPGTFSGRSGSVLLAISITTYRRCRTVTSWPCSGGLRVATDIGTPSCFRRTPILPPLGCARKQANNKEVLSLYGVSSVSESRVKRDA